jgi:hypothetical protein
MVTKMCDIINGKSFERLKFYTKKIHGAKSYVEFHNKTRKTTKELSDMVIISIATKNGNIIFEKTAFIQNKKESTPNKWGIDQDQLFLLHNFPTFRGSKGIFKSHFADDVILKNNSETLGNYGLFQSPGEMILINAKSVYKLQMGNEISLSDIRKNTCNNGITPKNYLNPFISIPYWDELKYRRYSQYLFSHLAFLNLPFLNNCIASFNIYEFTRNWTLFNIGELVRFDSNILDSNLSQLNNILIRELGIPSISNLSSEMTNFDQDLNIIISHLELDEK